MAGGADDQDEITGINVTPLVDVMLVLLIIFMVTANYIANQSLNLKLPKAATAEDAGTRNLALALSRDGALFLDGKEIAMTDLGARIEEAKLGGKELSALISADEATPHGTVVKLIDAVRKNGITDFAINVEVEPAGP